VMKNARKVSGEKDKERDNGNGGGGGGGSSTLAPPSLLGAFGASAPSLLSPMSPAPSLLGSGASFLRIRVADAVDAVHTSTTVPVSSAMYMQEVLELVCRRRKLPDAREYALILENILVPLDRTVASLQGKVNLLLVQRSMLAELGVDTGSRAARTTDPNGECTRVRVVRRRR
jgi:hypothetical protein